MSATGEAAAAAFLHSIEDAPDFSKEEGWDEIGHDDEGGATSNDESGHLTTDEANAKRIKRHFNEDLAYTDLAGWLRWDGRRFERNEDAARGCGALLGTIILSEAAEENLKGASASGAERTQHAATAKSLTAFSMQSENLSRVNAALVLAQAKLKRRADDFDSDGMLFNVRNGCLDLRTGELLKHERKFLMTKIAGTSFDPAAECPTWEKFLADVFQNDAELVSYLQRLSGYFLTARTTEHVMPVFHGNGANGKTTYLGTLEAILGEYARRAPAGMFEVRQDGREDQHMALLWGSRVVVGNETESGAKLRESFIKLATGGDRLSGRRLYQEAFDFAPTHKLVLATNYRPRVLGTDAGIWRRIQLIPFEARFSSEAGNLDPMMPAKLQAELPGILNWCVRGCLAWQRAGLNPPAKVRAATEEYRKAEDLVAQFVEERCELEPGAGATSADVYRAFTAWSEAAGILRNKMLKQRGLTEELKRLGVTPDRTGHKRDRALLGIRVLP